MTNYSDQKQRRIYNDQQKHNDEETEKGRNQLWIFKVKNWRNLVREDLDMAKKRKP